jgi:anti-anti-sigma factor
VRTAPVRYVVTESRPFDGAAWTAGLDDEGRPVFVVTGEIDLACAVALRSDLLAWMADLDDTRAVVDLSGTTFVDSTGLRTLVLANEATRYRRLVLRAPSRAVRSILDVTVPGRFEIEPGPGTGTGEDGR